VIRLCLAILRLYPDAWRQRYEPEMRAVIEQSAPSPATILDLLGGALDAHLYARLPTEATRQLRLSVITTVYCWIAFVLVGAGFAKATEDPPFRAAESAHGLLGGTRIAVAALAVLCCAVVIVAGAPLALAILREVGRGQRELRRALLRVGVAVGAFAVLTAGLVALAAHFHGNGGLLGHLAFVAWIALAVLAAVVCGHGVRRVLLEARLERTQLVPGIAGAWLLSRLMAAVTIAALLYAVALAADAPQVAGLSNGPLAFRTTAVLGGVVFVMALISGIALLSARRGRRAATAH
jgi:hypothetical protein